MSRLKFILGARGASVPPPEPPDWEQNYDFVGTVGTKLSTLGWELALGTDSMELNGSGSLRKITSAAASGLYLEGGQGHQQQSISADIGLSGTTGLGVFCFENNGINGYIIRRQAAGSLRLLRYNQGQSSSLVNTITVAAGVLIKLEAIVVDNVVTLNVYGDGALLTTFNDSTSNRLSYGRIGIAYTATSSITVVSGPIHTTATNYSGGTGVLSSTTIRVGRQTLAGNGGVFAALPSLGLLQSGKVGFWEFDRVSGDATAWPSHVESWVTPYPIRTLTDADAGTSAVYSVTIDGVLKPQTVTMTVQSIGESVPAISVSNNFDISIRLQANAASLGSKIIEFVDGCGDAFSDLAPAQFTTFKTHTGNFFIRRPPGSTKSIRAIAFADSARIRVQGLKVENSLPFALTPGGWDGSAGSGWSNNQNRPLIAFNIISIASVPYTCDDIQITDCTIGAPVANMSDKTTWYSGIAINGSTTDTAVKHTNIVIGAPTSDANPAASALVMTGGNTLMRVKDGISGGNVQYITIRGNYIRDFCSNSIFFGGRQLQDIDCWDNTCIDGWKNPSDIGDHPDFCQWGSTAVRADYERIKVRRNKFFIIDADNHSQGPFFNDIGFNGQGTGPQVTTGAFPQYLTNYVCVDCEVSNLIYNVGSSIATVMDLGTGWVLKNVTYVRGVGVNIQGAYTDPYPRGSVQTEVVSGITHRPTGVGSHIAAHQLTAMTGLTITDSVAYDVVKGGGTGLSGPPGQNETIRRAYYATFFANPGDPDVFAQVIPLENGPLMQGDGSYAGALNPNGSWAGIPV